MTEHQREFQEHHPDGEFKNWYTCPYCETRFYALSATDCPNGCSYEHPAEEPTEADKAAYQNERFDVFERRTQWNCRNNTKS